MLVLNIKRHDGSHYWTEHFNDRASLDSWLDAEKTRPYWKQDHIVEIEDKSQPLKTPEEIEAATAQAAARAALAAAKAFGNSVIEDFTLENMALGITVDGMTGDVRKATSEVMSALSTGSLYDAIDEIRAIPAEKKDPKYITDARLLAAINKIETFLGIALSEEL